jgi:membrane protease YdiL (CAAX protease family)
LVSFFAMAYALTWLAWSPWYLSKAGVGLLPYDGDSISDYLNTVALALGPTLSAFIMTGVTGGRDGVRRLLRRIVLWRVGLGWYLFVLLGIPAILVLSTIVLPGALASFQASAVPSTMFLYVVAGPVFLFAGGPVFEEIGWRGFAFPRLQRLHGPLVGSLVLGALWGLWHLPLFLIPSWDTPHGSLLDVALFVTWAVSTTIVITWVFNNTKGSVLLAILAHGSINSAAVAVYGLFPAPAVTGSITNVVVGFGVAALLVVVLTRGRLGYHQDENLGAV